MMIPRTLIPRIMRAVYLAALMLLVFTGIWRSQFSEDESQWIYTSRYLTLFSKGYFSSPEWDSYWTHTQPPFARYVMGASLKLGAFDLLALNGPWDFTKEPTDNEAEGNEPTSEMLTWARLPMGIISAISVLLIYKIGSEIGGTAAGLGAATWFTLNARIRELATRAEADGLMVFFMLAGLLLTIRLLLSQNSSAPTKKRAWLGLTLALGLVFGFGMASKLTISVGLIALPFSGIAILLFRRLTAYKVLRPNVPHIVAATAIAAVIAALLFVALNPALYSSPITGTFNLFRYRQAEMEQQMLAYPTGALAEGFPRIFAGIQRPLFTYSVGTSLTEWIGGHDARTLGESLPLDAIMVALGLGTAIAMIIRRLRNKAATAASTVTTDRRAEAGVIALTWTAIFYAAIVATMGLDWDRYTLPLMVFAALWAGVAIGSIAGWLSNLGARQPAAT